MKLSIVKTLGGVIKPAFDSDYELLKKIKPNTEYQCEIKQPRNYKLHKKYFALINLVYQNQEHYNNVEHLRKDLIIASGFYEKRYSFHGEEVTEAKSISFAKMSESDFNDLYSKTIDAICKYFHFDKQDIIDNVQQYF